MIDQKTWRRANNIRVWLIESRSPVFRAWWSMVDASFFYVLDWLRWLRFVTRDASQEKNALPETGKHTMMGDGASKPPWSISRIQNVRSMLFCSCSFYSFRMYALLIGCLGPINSNLGLEEHPLRVHGNLVAVYLRGTAYRLYCQMEWNMIHITSKLSITQAYSKIWLTLIILISKRHIVLKSLEPIFLK